LVPTAGLHCCCCLLLLAAAASAAALAARPVSEPARCNGCAKLLLGARVTV
jgi:hypothetical protein